MTPSFNLIDSSFIPCRMGDGSACDLSLAEILRDAHEIRDIVGDTPVVTLTVFRLLLAALHRIFGPRSRKAWSDMWACGRFDASVLDNYWSMWHSRFDILDNTHPFYQTAALETKAPLPASALFEELASNSNTTLFDHTVNCPPMQISPKRAALGLIARQAYSPGLGVSPRCRIGTREIAQSNRKDSPLARGQTVLCRGNSLFETLLLNLPHYECTEDDLPIWERAQPEDVMSRTQPSGRVDLYTWQSRRLRLIYTVDAAGGVSVYGLHYAQGRELHKDEIDPMKPYRRNDKKGWVTFSLSHKRALWRDSSAIFAMSSDAERPVPALNWVARAVADGTVPMAARCALDVFGVAYQPRKPTSVLLWRHERVPLPMAYLSDKDLVKSLEMAMDKADRLARSLFDVAHALAELLISPNGKNVNPKRFDSIRGRLHSQMETAFWSDLEVPFRSLLVKLAESEEERDRHLAYWVKDVLCNRARSAFEHAVKSIDQTARQLRALVRARRVLNSKLKQMVKPFEEVQDAQQA